jgi:hypothetical protein
MSFPVQSGGLGILIKFMPSTEHKPSRYKLTFNGKSKVYTKNYSNTLDEFKELLQKFYDDMELKIPEKGFLISQLDDFYVAVEVK